MPAFSVYVPIRYEDSSGNLLKSGYVAFLSNTVTIYDYEPDTCPFGYVLTSSSRYTVTVTALGEASPAELVFRFARYGATTAAPTPTATPVRTATPTPARTATAIPTLPSGNLYRYGTISMDQVPLRSIPGVSGSTLLKRLAKDTKVWVLKETVNTAQQSWLHVIADGTEGYVMTRYVDLMTSTESDLYEALSGTPVPDAYKPESTPAQAQPIVDELSSYGQVIVPDAPLYELPDETSYVREVLSREDVVRVTGERETDGGSWYVVAYGNYWGYVQADGIRMMTVAEAAAWLGAQGIEPDEGDSLSSYGYVNASAVNLRSGASTSSKRTAILRRYAFCLVLGTEESEGESWYHVIYGGQEGYITASYFKQLTQAELAEFLASEEYQEGVRSNTP